MRRLAGLALAAFLLTGAAAAGGTVKRKPLLFTVEVSGSQAVTWALDEKVPHAGAICLGSGGVELGAQSWMVPVRGSGRLRYTFAGREENVQGDSVDLKAPTHGTIHGTDGIYWKSEGYWDPYNCCDWDPPIGENAIAIHAPPPKMRMSARMSSIPLSAAARADQCRALSRAGAR